MAKTRTFIAVEASAEVKRAASALADRLAPTARDVRWVNPDGMHYTLQFLGDITDQEIADVCTRTARAAAGASPFMLQAQGAGAFPDLQRPRTLWVGARDGTSELIDLQAAIGEEMDGLGFRGENRRYVPHLTIGKTGRTRSAAAELTPLLQELADYDAGSMRVERVTVFASELLREGPEYHVLAHCPLQG